jgi:hypothetical protein
MDKTTTFFTVLSHCQRLCGAHLEDKTTIAIHLCKNGFVVGYEVQKFYSESSNRVIVEDEQDYDVGVDRMDEMFDAI